MKLFALLRKPDWEHANPERRARAVAHSDDAALLTRLAEIAQADPAPAVRIAALARLDDLALLERRLRGEREVAVAEAARQRLGRLLSGRTPAEGGEALVGQLLDDPLLLQLASEAADPAIRRAALRRIDRPGLWLDRCMHDSDAALRLWALERISDPDALRRIADTVRKRDKRLARAARDKFDALGLAAGDPQTLRRRALELSDQFAQLGRQLPEDRESRMLALDAEWSALRPRLDTDLQRRVDGAAAMAQAALAGARGERPPVRDDAPAPPAVEAPAQPDPLDALRALQARLPAVGAADSAAVLDRLEAELALLTPSPPQDEVRRVLQQIAALRAGIRARERAQREAQQAEAWKLAVTALGDALDAGHPGPARVAREACAPLARTPSQQRELAALDARLAELDRWQRWAGNKARQRLCDEVATLAGSGLHPDALATRLRELQDEWTRLDGIDGEAAPGAEHGLSKRFRGLCARAIAPAKAYFVKRDALRKERAETVDELLARSASLPAGQALRELRGDIASALRDLDGVPPAQRSALGRRLRERLQAIDAAQSAEREAAVLDKRRLLARLRRDLGAAEPAARIALAKAAQAEWKALPRAERKTEDALWAELRELLDPLFAGERERDAAREAAQVEQQAAAQAILDELQALAAADDERLQHAAAHLEQIVSRWRALPLEAASAPPVARGDRGRPPARRAPQHPWQARFDRLQAEVEAAMAAAALRRRALTLEALCAAGTLIDRLETADAGAREALRQEFEALPLGSEDRAALRRRLDASAASPLASEAAERLVVRAELIAGIESPSASAALRREAQMQRLAAKLEGGSEPPPAEALHALLRSLQAQPLADPGLREALLARWRAAWAGMSRAGVVQ